MAQAKGMARLLVLGASGKLGRMLARLWHDAPPSGWEITWQFRREPGEGRVVWEPGAPLPLRRADAILALWGVTAGDDAALAENSRLAIEAQDLGRALGAARVFHCSSAAVYAPEAVLLPESRAGGPARPYGAAKLAMEHALADWVLAHPEGPAAVALRLANVVGADSLFAAITGGRGAVTLDRFSDGEGPWRSYVTVPALARVVEALLTAERIPFALNVATPRPVAMEALARAAGCDVAWREAPETAARMVALDTALLQALAPLPDQDAAGMIADWRRTSPEAACGGGRP